VYAAERQQAIHREAQRTGRVEVAALARAYGVSPETIRRDLAALHDAGTLRRVHGGAILAERLVSFERGLPDRSSVMAEQKLRIGRAALDLVPEGGTLFVEGGSTPGVFAELLPQNWDLTVVTTGLPIAVELAARAGFTVHLVGGRVRGRTLAAVDDWAVHTLRGVRVDVAFLGTNGFSAEDGLTTPDSAEAAVKRAALGIAGQTVLLADNTKINAKCLCRYGDASDIDLLVTDDGVPAREVRRLREGGLEVRIS
jgi:DeoR family fructose operon transcriptional repressor